MPDFYGTIEGYNAYHAARDTDIVAASDVEIEAALLVASEWIDGVYRSSFGGLKVGMRAQVREWPRHSAFDVYAYAIASDAIPVEIEQATYEAAAKQIASPGSLVMDWTPGKYKRVSIDGALSVEYAGFSSSADVQTRFAKIDQILSPILTGHGVGNYSPLSGDIARA